MKARGKKKEKLTIIPTWVAHRLVWIELQTKLNNLKP